MKQVTGLLVVASVCAAKVGFVEQLLWSTVCGTEQCDLCHAEALAVASVRRLIYRG